MESLFILGFALAIGLWFLWRLRRYIWFLLLFFGAITVLLVAGGHIPNLGIIGPIVALVLIVITAYNFAKKRF